MNPEPTLCPCCRKRVTPEDDAVVITMFRPTKVAYLHRVCP